MEKIPVSCIPSKKPRNGFWWSHKYHCNDKAFVGWLYSGMCKKWLCTTVICWKLITENCYCDHAILLYVRCAMCNVRKYEIIYKKSNFINEQFWLIIWTHYTKLFFVYNWKSRSLFFRHRITHVILISMNIYLVISSAILSRLILNIPIVILLFCINVFKLG